MKEQRKERYTGKLSFGAKKRLTKAVTLLVQSIQGKWIFNEVSERYTFHKLSFITLTVSTSERNLSGKEAYHLLLKHFLQWLRRTKGVKTYLWKAELQKRGQIHYHITTPSFINYQEIKDKWNNLQRKAGLLNDYYKKKGHYEANSTDIHSVKNITDLAAYLIKYIAKESQNEVSLGGKVWDCSDNLKLNNYFTLPLTNDHEEFLEMAKTHKAAKEVIGDRYALYKFQEHPEEYLLSEDEFKNYKTFLHCIRINQDYISYRPSKTENL